MRWMADLNPREKGKSCGLIHWLEQAAAGLPLLQGIALRVRHTIPIQGLMPGENPVEGNRTQMEKNGALHKDSEF